MKQYAVLVVFVTLIQGAAATSVWDVDSFEGGKHMGTVTENGDLMLNYSVQDGVVVYQTLTLKLTNSSSFGETLTGGDFNGDGVMDLAAGCPSWGWAVAYLGNGTTLTESWNASYSGELFGSSLAGYGDYNNDSYTDLLVGAPSGEGTLYLFSGSGSGLSADPVWSYSGYDQNSGIGTAVAWGDFNGDSHDDAVVGAADFSSWGVSGAGMVSVFYSTGDSLPAAPDWISVGSNTSSAHYGASLAVGDFNSDSYDDLAVGASGEEKVYIYLGSASGLNTTPDAEIGSPGPAGFGAAATAGDVNMDSFDDLLVAAPVGGGVYLYHGEASGINTTYIWNASGGMDFGAAAVIGDLNLDERPDVLVGSPLSGEMYGYINSLSGLPLQPALKYSPGMNQSRFGSSAWFIGDMDGGPGAEFAVSEPYHNTTAGMVYILTYGVKNHTMSGTYTSPAYSLGGKAVFGQISWDSSTPMGASVKIQLRTGSTQDELNSSEFVGPDGTNATYYTYPQDIWEGHSNASWVQFRVYISTPDSSTTPVLHSVSVAYNLRPTLEFLTPQQGGVLSGEVNISWNASDPDGDPLTFDLSIKGQGDAGFTPIAAGLTGSLYTLNTSSYPDGKYTLKLQARDNGSIPLVEERTLDITISNGALPVATLISPEDNSTLYGDSVTFQWSGNAELYFLMVGSSPSSLMDYYHGSDTTATVMLSPGKYYWSVVPQMGSMNGTCTSGMWSFVLKKLPEAELISPGNGTRVATTFEMSWKGSAGLTYTLMLGESPTSMKTLAETSSTTYTAALSPGTYYWTVIPHAGSVEGRCVSGIWSLTVNTPPGVRLVAPEDGSTLSTAEVEFRWSGDDAEMDPLVYALYVDGEPVVENYTQMSYLTELGPGDHTWWISAWDGYDTSSTPAFRFTITQEVNHAPVLGEYSPARDVVVLTAGKAQKFSVRASDPDGDQLTAAWYINEEFAGSGWNLTYTADRAGNYTVKCVVSDGTLTASKVWSLHVVSSAGERHPTKASPSGALNLIVVIILVVVVSALAYRGSKA